MKKATCQENIEPAPKLWLQVSSAGPGRGEHDSLKGWDGVRGLGLGLGQNRSIDPRLWKVNSPLFAELWYPGAKAYVKVFRTLGGTLEAISAAWSEYVLIGQDWLAFGATRVSSSRQTCAIPAIYSRTRELDDYSCRNFGVQSDMTK